MGAAFAALVTAFVNTLVMPVIAAIFGKVNFNSLTFTIHHSVFFYGAFTTPRPGSRGRAGAARARGGAERSEQEHGAGVRLFDAATPTVCAAIVVLRLLA